MQNYLKSEELSCRKQRLLFQLRTRMIKVGMNYGKSNLCPLGCPFQDSQEHLFQCNQIPKESKQFEYSDIFSNEATKFSYIANLAQELLRKREEQIMLLARKREEQIML